MNVYEIPLSPEPQKFSIALAGITRQMRFQWSPYQSCWCFDVLDAQGNELVTSVSVVTGIDLLAQYKHLELGGSIVAQCDYDSDCVPTFENLGTQGHIFFIVE